VTRRRESSKQVAMKIVEKVANKSQWKEVEKVAKQVTTKRSRESGKWVAVTKKKGEWQTSYLLWTSSSFEQVASFEWVHPLNKLPPSNKFMFQMCSSFEHVHPLNKLPPLNKFILWTSHLLWTSSSFQCVHPSNIFILQRCPYFECVHTSNEFILQMFLSFEWAKLCCVVKCHNATCASNFLRIFTTIFCKVYVIMSWQVSMQ